MNTLKLHLNNYIVCFFQYEAISDLFILHLHLLYQPYVNLCQATCVLSQQRQPLHVVTVANSEVLVLAANTQDFFNYSNCSFNAAVLPINPDIYTDH